MAVRPILKKKKNVEHAVVISVHIPEHHPIQIPYLDRIESCLKWSEVVHKILGIASQNFVCLFSPVTTNSFYF